MKITFDIFLASYVIVAWNIQEIFSTLERGERYKTGTFASIEGTSAKHVITTTYAIDSFECLADCLSHPTCQSINFQKKGSPKHLCELSESVIVSSSQCQRPRPDYIFFYPAKIPLINCSVEAMTCKNGGTCIDSCSGHVCKCQPFNTGDYCEKWTTDVFSCKDVLNKTSYRENMAYTFNIGYHEVTIYCHLTNDICGGGGWTLAMKVDGSQTQFQYSAALWSNKQSHNLTAGQTGFDNYQTKMPSYWAMPFGKLCVGFRVNNVLKWIVIPYKASSLYDVIADGTHRSTSIGRATWMSLIGGASLQSYCNKEGFNVLDRTRLGIASNNEHNCESCDSALGLGLQRYSLSCGNYCASSGCSISHKQTAVFGYVMIQ